MAFVRKKRVRDKHYLQLVESRREDGKIRQRVVVHVGEYESLEAAVGSWEAGTSWTKGRRVMAPSGIRQKAEMVRRYVVLDESMVSRERREAEHWKAGAMDRLREATEVLERSSR